jgi:Rps23 Pro-64 3,4-dihydroxylase Tpa1-like proline 4-hydroxylase
MIFARLEAASGHARAQYGRGKYFVVDELLPHDLAMRVWKAFPDTSALMLRKSLREVKYVTSQMDRCDPALEECVYAFQDPRVVRVVARITDLEGVEPDERLYAGGISVMGVGHYLHPHIDNSHDMERGRYRILNLLYYTSPDWEESNGGNFELWPEGFTKPLTIHSKFNRLLVVATNRYSWHSVSRVKVPALRACVSNYYFSSISPEHEEYFHVTSFRGRPEQPLLDFVLRADSWVRGALRKVAARGLFKTKHYYAKNR